MTTKAKLCPACGYLHQVSGSSNADLCDRCGASLTRILNDLFRMQNVSTRRRDRILSDEEERLRQGYEVSTGVRFARHGNGQQVATVAGAHGHVLWQLAYGDAATLWRINLGWSRRQNRNDFGFWLDIERGYWQRNESDPDSDDEDPMSASLKRVIPYVEDYKNALLLEPAEPLDKEVVASLQSALQKAIQAIYQLEDSELAVEPLPSLRERHLILMYEASEGGAGVLRQLLEDPGAMSAIAQEALRICHFDPEDGTDLHRAPGAREDCEAACYDCLLSYYNQTDHLLLDRQLILPYLLDLKASTVKSSPKALSRAEHLEQLRNLCGSELEREWLDALEQHNLRLPNHAQYLVAASGVRPDFYYEVDGYHAAIFIDGPHHDEPDQKAKDQQNDDQLFMAGIDSIRFHYLADWTAVFRHHAHIFGQPNL